MILLSGYFEGKENGKEVLPRRKKNLSPALPLMKFKK
jgi:hypothetical protein